MIEIYLSRRERDLIGEWIDHVQRKDSLFGDDPIILPDEEIVRQKLERDNPLNFTACHLECVIEWGLQSPVCTEEKSLLIDRLRAGREKG